MRAIPAIVESVFAGIDSAVVAFDKAFTELRELNFQVEKAGKKLEEAQRRDQNLRLQQSEKELECGRYLADVHKSWPVGRPPKTWKYGTWEQFCLKRGIDRRTAWNYMAKVSYFEKSETPSDVSDFPSVREVAAARRAERELETQPDRFDPDEVESYTEPTPANDEAPEVPTRTSGRGKPQWLMRALISDYTRSGDLVCDPLAGFGSTLVAAESLGRRAIGSEIDADIVTQSGLGTVRLGDYRTALIDAGDVDAVITDPPYSARTHAAATTRSDGSSAEGLTPTYGAWSPDDVHEFVKHWSPRTRGWMVALTDSELIDAWKDAYRAAGRYAFAPVPVVIRGMSVRISGDGPSSWCVYAMVARPRELSKWGTLPGAYVGTKERELWDAGGDRG